MSTDHKHGKGVEEPKALFNHLVNIHGLSERQANMLSPEDHERLHLVNPKPDEQIKPEDLSLDELTSKLSASGFTLKVKPGFNQHYGPLVTRACYQANQQHHDDMFDGDTKAAEANVGRAVHEILDAFESQVVLEHMGRVVLERLGLDPDEAEISVIGAFDVQSLFGTSEEASDADV